MYVREVIRDKLLTSSFLEHVAALTKKWNPVKVSVETTAFQKTLLKTYREWSIKHHHNIPWVEVERGRSSKRKRILSFQPRVERGDFSIEEGIRNYEWIIDEMTTYPRSTHDDILDTLADLDALFFSSPEDSQREIPKNTYDGYYGSVEDEGIDMDESFSCSVIG
jgi:predicted phage terminase large subunit-like protein